MQLVTQPFNAFLMLAQMDAVGNHWYGGSPLSAMGWTAAFSLYGTIIAILAYKLFDKATPGDLHKEIIENKNMAAAMIGAAIILGVCIVVAAAIVG